ncbi:MAG: hypothetical protein IK065_05205 [Neisseriaceae bacterium]|nr:hypothetical protein [Neisseriaceae bacterium]
MGFTTHQNAVGVNPLYFNNFLFSPIGRLVGKDAHHTAFLFQKLGFADVSNKIKETPAKLIILNFTK